METAQLLRKTFKPNNFAVHDSHASVVPASVCVSSCALVTSWGADELCSLLEFSSFVAVSCGELFWSTCSCVCFSSVLIECWLGVLGMESLPCTCILYLYVLLVVSTLPAQLGKVHQKEAITQLHHVLLDGHITHSPMANYCKNSQRTWYMYTLVLY